MTGTLPSRAQTGAQQKHDTSNYHERLKAAGLDGDMPDDMDEFRNELARSIAMYLNEWHGCPERLCRRHHGCMAPNIRCSNWPPFSEEELERDWPEAKAEIVQLLQELRAEHGEEWE